MKNTKYTGNTEELPYWKGLWLRVSGKKTTSLNTLKEELLNYKKHFFNGFFHKEHINDNIIHLRQKLSISEQMWSLLTRLCHLLDLDGQSGWGFLCHYLLHEFQGAPDTLSDKTETHISATELLHDLWNFYAFERMYYLKCLKLILEFEEDQNYPFNIEFKEFLQVCDIKKLRGTFLKQFRQIILCQIVDSKDMTESMKDVWIDRNFNEQIEIIQCVLLTHSKSPLTAQELMEWMKLFKGHHYSTKCNRKINLKSALQLKMQQVAFNEVVFVLSILDNLHLNEADIWDIEEKKRVRYWIEQYMLKNYPVMSPVIISWTLIRNPDLEFFQPEIIVMACKVLFAILNEKIFSDTSKYSNIVNKSIFNLLLLISTKQGDFMDSQPFYNSWSLVLQNKKVSDLFWTENLDDSFYEEIQHVWEKAKLVFPYNFTFYTLLAKGLASASSESLQMVLEDTLNLKVFCSPMDTLNGSISSDNVLNKDVKPFGTNQLILKQGSVVHLRKAEDELQFFTACVITKYNYWQVLDYLIMHLQNEIISKVEVHQTIPEGLVFLECVLKHLNTKYQLPCELEKPVARTLSLLEDMIISDCMWSELYAIIIAIMTEALKFSSDALSLRLKKLDFFPKFYNEELSMEDLIKPRNIHQGRIYELIVEQDFIEKNYTLLSAYMKFIRRRFEKNSVDSYTFELPGVIFFLRFVLPNLTNYCLLIDTAEHEILHEIIDVVFDILQISDEQTKENPQKEVLRKYVISELLHSSSNTVILNLVSTENTTLETIIHRQSNWMTGKGIKFLKLIQMSLSIILYLFKLKSRIYDKQSINNETPLEMIMFSQPQNEVTLKIIRSILSYIRHTFNDKLPVLACRVLRKFAKKLDVSLYGCFNIDNDEIRHFFIYPLRDKNVNSEFKTALLELIIACVPGQPGLTKAFFSRTKDEALSTDDFSLLGLMEEFLCLINAQSDLLNHQMIGSVMNLYHQLWKHQKQNLVLEIQKNPKFWEYLCSPLKFDIHSDMRAYVEIFNILSIEMYQNKNNLNTSVDSFLTEFFETPESNFKKWITYIYGENLKNVEYSLSFEDETPYWLSLLQAWKDFTVICMKCHSSLFDEKIKRIIGHECLSALLSQLEILKDSRPILILAENFVMMLREWGREAFVESNKAVVLVSNIVSLTASNYDSFQERTKRALLSAIIMSVNTLKPQIESHRTSSISLLYNSCEMARKELEIINPQSATNNEALLKMHLLNEMLTICASDSEFRLFCKSFELYEILVRSLASIIQHKQHRLLSISIIDCLTFLVKSSYGPDFVYYEFCSNLWMKFLPPKEIGQENVKEAVKSETLWTSTEWCGIYRRAVQMIAFILREHSGIFLSDAFMFVSVHIQVIVDYITLTQNTINLEALDVCETIVMFIYNLLKHKRLWQASCADTFGEITNALLIGLHHTISLLMSPMALSHLVERKDKFTDSPTVIKTMNKLIDIVMYISLTLGKISPPLMDILCNQEFLTNQWTFFLNLSFTIPRPFMKNNINVNFGTILSAVNLFTRSLLQINSGKGKISHSPTSFRYSKSFFDIYKPLHRRSLTEYDFLQGSEMRSPSGSLRYPDFSELELYPQSPSITALSHSWLKCINETKAMRTLESILYLLASQLMLFLMNPDLQRIERQHVCREISSELSVFSDLMNKLAKGQTIKSKRGRGVLRLAHKPQKKLGKTSEDGDNFIHLTKVFTSEYDMFVLFNRLFEVIFKDDDF